MAESVEKLTTITDYIDQNQKTMAVIGVLTALAVFWDSLPEKSLSPEVPFFLFIATIPLYFELWRNFDYKKSTKLLVLFFNLLSPVILGATRFVFLSFRGEWQSRMSQVVLWCFALPLWLLYKKYNLRIKLGRASLHGLGYLMGRVWFRRSKAESKEIFKDNSGEEKLLDEIAPAVSVVFISLVIIVGVNINQPIANVINYQLSEINRRTMHPAEPIVPAVPEPTPSPTSSPATTP